MNLFKIRVPILPLFVVIIHAVIRCLFFFVLLESVYVYLAATKYESMHGGINYLDLFERMNDFQRQRGSVVFTLGYLLQAGRTVTSRLEMSMPCLFVCFVKRSVTFHFFILITNSMKTEYRETPKSHSDFPLQPTKQKGLPKGISFQIETARCRDGLFL